MGRPRRPDVRAPRHGRLPRTVARPDGAVRRARARLLRGARPRRLGAHPPRHTQLGRARARRLGPGGGDGRARVDGGLHALLSPGSRRARPSRAQRGDPDPWTPLGRGARGRRTGPASSGGQWQVAAAEAEALWLAGRPEAIADATAETFELAMRLGSPWVVAELAWWRRQGGVGEPVPADAGGPFELQLRGDWSGAAAAWRDRRLSLRGGARARGVRRRGRAPAGARGAPGARSPARGGDRRAPPAGARRAWGSARAAAGDEGKSGEPHAARARGARAGGAGSPKRRGRAAARCCPSGPSTHHVSSILRKLGRSQARGGRREAIRLGLAERESW